MWCRAICSDSLPDQIFIKNSFLFYFLNLQGVIPLHQVKSENKQLSFRAEFEVLNINHPFISFLCDLEQNEASCTWFIWSFTGGSYYFWFYIDFRLYIGLHLCFRLHFALTFQALAPPCISSCVGAITWWMTVTLAASHDQLELNFKILMFRTGYLMLSLISYQFKLNTLILSAFHA